MSRLRRIAGRARRSLTRHLRTGGPVSMNNFEESQGILTEKIMPLDGWLLQEAAIYTLFLLQLQKDESVTGDIYEIGVFRGKYFAVLNLMRRPGETLLGIDTFDHHSTPQQVEDSFAAVFGNTQDIRLEQLNSATLAATDVAALMPSGQARFISVDGSHEAPDVAHDLGLAAATLAPGGIVAVDDLLNPVAIGVSEGFYRFALQNPASDTLVPFAFCRNKCFLCRPDMHARYLQATEQFMLEQRELIRCPHQNGHLMREGKYFLQTLLGAKLLTLA